MPHRRAKGAEPLVETVSRDKQSSDRSLLKRFQKGQVDEIARQTQRSRRSVERALQNFRVRLQALLHEDA